MKFLNSVMQVNISNDKKILLGKKTTTTTTVTKTAVHDCRTAHDDKTRVATTLNNF